MLPPDPSDHARPVAFRVGLVLMLVLGACSTTPKQPTTSPQAYAAIPNDGNEFVVAETMNDTWNTVGQVLVSVDGVVYEGRAQMLGLYIVRYRGEPFLVRTQALLATAAAPGVRTRVDALNSSGAPLRTAATSALLGILAQRVPVEAPRYRQSTWQKRARKPTQKKPSVRKKAG